MAASDLNPAPNRGLVGIFKIGGRDVEVDVRPSMVDQEGEVADISLGWCALGCGGSGSANMRKCDDAIGRTSFSHFCGQNFILGALSEGKA